MSKKPEVGQWWVQTNKQDRSDAKYFRAFFCGHTADGSLLFESVDGSIEKDAGGLNWENWHHEPACTGWDWVKEVKPETEYPIWYVPRNPNEVCESFKKPIAYYRRDSEKRGETFYTDGESFKWGYWESELDNEIIACSQADAEARVTKTPKAEAVESPDDWVTQDRVPARKGVDEYRWIWRSGDPSRWMTYNDPDVENHAHGHHGFECRCRRKDLPVVEAKTTQGSAGR